MARLCVHFDHNSSFKMSQIEEMRLVTIARQSARKCFAEMATKEEVSKVDLDSMINVAFGIWQQEKRKAVEDWQQVLRFTLKEVLKKEQARVLGEPDSTTSKA